MRGDIHDFALLVTPEEMNSKEAGTPSSSNRMT